MKKFLIIGIVLAVIVVLLLLLKSRDQNDGDSLLIIPDNISEDVMVLSYSQMSESESKSKLRVEIPHGFSYTPTSVRVVRSDASNEVNLVVASNSEQYECMSMEDSDHPMLGFQSDFFEGEISYENEVRVIFKDQSGAEYTHTYPIAHICTQLHGLKTFTPDKTQSELPPE